MKLEWEPPDGAATVFGPRLQVARRYVEWLGTAGIERGLVGPREADRLWERHVLNCAVVGDLIDEGERVCDVGSGAGLPGVALAIARPDLDVVLLEPMQRRVDFLEETVERLGLPGVTVVRGRGGEFRPDVPFDVTTARAVAKMGRLAEWSAGLLRPGGRLLALKGESVYEELRREAKVLRRHGMSSWTVESVGGDVVSPATVVAVVMNDGRSGP
ncbi:16S rRNA (guanine(527)-N(7))-methyltransferase RsmG [Phytoactinopolyspora halotolerans]|uniref:Ribosomal RNA small subunit methyltransferase G n=1 Tax=Phytoactinopolyspora halotolerans TaxID=1981512 RepID=A0A6L9S0Z0_9ACTN|nr:16S rRNA (guanine(527)-N(7))-methyltransferase RsmG [Phytoactinopolyspora halotolerans]NED98696.1 16S rRNA (guanine(527)-N(7))-methyltransferase RsmG [Phytoactinopolyspora halotolerans]